MKTISKIVCVLAIFILMIGVFGTVQASMESINVEAGKEAVRTIDVKDGDTVFIIIKTPGGETHKTIGFWMLFPNSTKHDFGQITEYTARFDSKTDGKCELHFDNSNSTESILVTLNFSKDRYYFGIPQWIFLLMIIGVLLAIVALGYLIMGKH